MILHLACNEKVFEYKWYSEIIFKFFDILKVSVRNVEMSKNHKTRFIKYL